MKGFGKQDLADIQFSISRQAQSRDIERVQAVTPCPSTGKSSGARPGYVIDHVESLKRGGADAPSKMQWQTKEQAKEKDKIEQCLNFTSHQQGGKK